MFEKCESYIYDKAQDTIIYTENFDHLNQNVFSPVNEDKIDGLKLAQHTSWTPTKDQLYIDCATYDPNKVHIENRIDAVFHIT